MAAPERKEINWNNVFSRSLIFLITAVVACMFGYASYQGWLEFTSGDTQYTVTITSVDGLDPAALEQRGDLPAAPFSPVFHIALRIDNTLYKADKRCIGMHSSAVISYGDAVLGKGTVPEFCAPALGLNETTVTAWAMDVSMPRFLRNRLAGELARGEAAVLDVAVRAPGCGKCYLYMDDDAPMLTPGHGSCNIYRCMDQLLLCKAKIGEGPSPPCLVTDVNLGSTATN